VTITFLDRDAWTTHGPAKPLTELDAPVGVAVHWPGATGQIGQSQDAIASRLEGYRAFHVNVRGWNDIAYQMAIDNAGRIWKLRGERFMSAANGDQDVNQAWGAVLLMLDQDDKPSEDMVEAFRVWRKTRWLTRFPHAIRIAPHSAVRPDATDCPGDAARALIRSGRLTEEAVTPEDIDRIADRVVSKLMEADVVPAVHADGTPLDGVPGNTTWKVKNALGRILRISVESAQAPPRP
jgi:hypothetical protein